MSSSDSGSVESKRVSASQRIERAFEAWGYLVCRNRSLCILLALLMTAFFVSWLPQIEIDNSSESFLTKDDPESIRFDAFREQFGRDDSLLIAVRTASVFDLAFLEKLRDLHDALEAQLPYIAEITSLVNARSTRGEGDELIVEDLMEDWPETEADLLDLKRRVLSNPLYENTLVSTDATFTTLTVEPFTYSTHVRDAVDDLQAGFDESEGPDAEPPGYLTSDETSELTRAAEEVVARFEGPDFEIFMAGVPMLESRINRYMIADLERYMTAAFAVITLLLYLLFRRVLGAIIPLIVVFLSLLTTLGIMVLLDLPASAAAQMLPILLLAVGICDAVHILVIVYQRIGEGDERADAIGFALGHSGLAIVMTSLTTAAGMISFAGAKLAPVSVLGIIAPIGVGMALIYSLVLLPALLASVPLVPRSRRAGRRTFEILGTGLARIGDKAARNPALVLAGTALVTAIGLAGAAQVRFSHNGMEWFPEGEPLKIAAAEFDREMRGSITLEAVISTEKANGLNDPELLRRIEAAMRRSEAIEQPPVFIGRATSLVDVVKEINRALNENRDDEYRLPEDRLLVAQELLLFEQTGSDDLEKIVDSQYQMARLTFRVPWADATLYPELIREVEGELRPILGDELRLEMTGLLVVLARVFNALLTSMTRSYVIALVLITPMMILLLGSWRRGLLSMIPNLLPVITTLGVMGWLDIPLDISTIMIGAIVIGIAVDDTIHFMHKFQRYYEDTGDAYSAIRSTLETTGAALLFTTLVLTGGFGVISLGTLVNIQNFGILAAFATGAAFVADLLVSPALMALATRGPTQDS